MSVDADLTASVTAGSSTITLASVPAWVKVGHFYIVDQLDDPSFVSANTGREVLTATACELETVLGPGPVNQGAIENGYDGHRGISLSYPFSTAFQAQIAEAAMIRPRRLRSHVWDRGPGP